MINRLSHLFGKQIWADNEVSIGGPTKRPWHVPAIALLAPCAFCRGACLAHQVAVSARGGTGDKQQGRALLVPMGVCPSTCGHRRNQRIVPKKGFFREEGYTLLMVIGTRKA